MTYRTCPINCICEDFMTRICPSRCLCLQCDSYPCSSCYGFASKSDDGSFVPKNLAKGRGYCRSCYFEFKKKITTPSAQYLKNGGEKLQSGDTSEFGKAQLFLDSPEVCLEIKPQKRQGDRKREAKKAASAKKAGGGEAK